MKKSILLVTVLMALVSLCLVFASCDSGSSDSDDPTPGSFYCPLPSVFSVSDTETVHFSKGNLYWDGDSFEFENNQYDFQSSWNASHVSHFYWSKNASVAYADSYSETDITDSDVFFTDAEGFTVNGEKGKYRTLSKAEWNYLIWSRTKASTLRKFGVTVCGKKKCLILAPDTFTGTIKDSYNEKTWAAAEANGLVCLPAAGYRCGSGVDRVGDLGNYWSSTLYSLDYADYLYFNSLIVNPTYNKQRSYGLSVRLVF